MTPRETLAAALARGVHLWADGVELHMRAPKGALPPELKSELSRAKPDIVEILGDHRKHAIASFAQKRLWFFDQLEPNNSTFNMYGAFKLTGPLDVSAVEFAFVEIVQRHETLRTSFIALENEPVQVVSQTQSLALEFIDLCDLDQDIREEKAQEAIARLVRIPFDLTHAPLLRVALIRINSDQHFLVPVIHHIVSDGWSLRILLREFSAIYAARVQGKQHDLPQLPIQYADFARRQRSLLNTEWDQHMAYWRQNLQLPLPSLELPTDKSRPAIQTFHGGSEKRRLSKELSERVKALAQAHGATPFMAYLAVFQALLQRLSGQYDIIVGAPIAARSMAHTENLIGFFGNTLAFRVDHSGTPTYDELLTRVRNVALNALQHQDVPFEKIVEDLQPERDLSRTPIFQVMFNLINLGSLQLDLPDLHVQTTERPEAESKFDLTLYVRTFPEGAELNLVYNRDLFEPETARSMLEQYGMLLKQCINTPDRPLRKASLLTQAQQDRRASNCYSKAPGSFVEFPDSEIGESISARFERQVVRHPDRRAIKSQSYDWTYAEMNGHANRVAHALLALKRATSDRVALLFRQDAPMLAGMLGCLKSGLCYVPLDPSYPLARLEYMLDDCQACTMVVDKANYDLARTLSRNDLPIIQFDALDDPSGEGNPCNDIPSAALAYILYTSGSTGQPKGVVQNHGNVLHFIQAYTNNLKISPDDRLSLIPSYSFDAAVMDIYGGLLNGAALYMAGLKEGSPADTIHCIRNNQITIYHSTPTVFRYFCDELANDEVLDHVRLVVLGGEEVQSRELSLFKKHFPNGCVFVNGLGPTESTVTLQHFMTRDFTLVGNAVPVGHAVDRTNVLLLDAKGTDVQLHGEIAIRSPHVALGYWNKPELTEAAFHKDPQDARLRVYRTGDLGRRRHDGSIEFLGRKDFQVKVRGFRIELQEIESAILAHPSVKECAVMAFEQRQGENRLAAYIVFVTPKTSGMEAIEESLRQRLPDYMVPSVFVELAALPLTPTGKIDRKALPEPTVSEEAEYVAPRNPIEEVLVQIWAEVLKVEKVGIRDRFFDLGGHSLSATQVMSRVRNAFQIEIPLRAVFEDPTIAGLANRIAAAQRDSSHSASPPLLQSAHADFTPLSFAQQRLWFLDQLGAKDGAYTIAAAVRLHGELDIDVLTKTVNEIVRRQESMRTRLVVVDGEPRQNVIAHLEVDLPIHDVESLSPPEREARARNVLETETRRPFDLGEAPLFRVCLVRFSRGEHILLITMHHIISDAWSMGVLIREVGALYDAIGQGQPSPLSDPPIQYRDFAVWQRSWIQGDALQAQLDHWTRALDGASHVLSLSTDKPRPPVQSFQGGRVVRSLPADLMEDLQRLCKTEGVTLFMTLLAGFEALLHRYSGQEDFIIGSPIANRTRSELEGLVGFFVNTLAFRANVAENPTFRELLRRVRETALGAYAHQDLPFEKLVEALQPERDLSRAPLFQVAFVLQNAPRSMQSSSGLTFERVNLDSGRSKFDLSMAVSETEEGFQAAVEYCSDLFERETIERLLVHYETLLRSAVARPETPVGVLRLLSQDEEVLLLDSWNDTRNAFDATRGVWQVVEAFAESRPGAPAVIVGDETVTYCELNRRANYVAHELKAAGVQPHDLVAVCMERSSAMIASLLGVLKTGAAYVPLDPGAPSERIRFMIQDSHCRVVVTQSSLNRLCSEAGRPVILVDGDWPDGDVGNLDTLFSPEQLAYAIYTSGSTGAPKGVLLEHRGLLNLVSWHQRTFEITSRDKSTHLAGLAFDASVWEIWPYLTAGACIYLVDDETRTSPEHMQRFLLEKEITVSFLPPALAESMMSMDWPSDTPLRIVHTGGDKLQHYPPATLPFTLVNNYGPTECTIVATSGAVAPQANPSHAPSLGKPLDNLCLYVLDPNLQLAPIGVPGELYIGGVGLAREYLNQPELTSEKFIRNPFSDDQRDRLYKTGDLVRWLPCGEIEFLGRTDFQIKLRGYRIELGEIEAALASHPNVREAVATLFDSGSSGKHIVAYVGCQGELTSNELRGYLRDRLPEYMVPVSIMILDALPLTAHGKIDRKALPKSDLVAAMASREYVAPRTQTEEIIANIWRDMLKLDRVSIHDRFFDIGGHSLSATQVVSRIRAAFAVELTLRSFFETPTIAELAKRVESAQAKSVTPSIERRARPNRIPLSYAQQRLWFLDQMGARDGIYSIPTALRMRGALNVRALETALNTVVQRHESLRTSFLSENGQPYQHIGQSVELPLAVVDLQSFPVNKREAEARWLALLDAKKPFDLSKPPLLRAQLLRLDEHEYVFLLTIHHIISDGWSMGVLVREVLASYECACKGQEPRLPELSIQYADYALWQREHLQGDVLEQSLDYWQRDLAGTPTSLSLPTDYPRPPVQTFRGNRLTLTIGAEALKKLRDLGHRHDTTLFMTLLTAFEVLLSKYANQEEFIVGTPIANRDRHELEGLIGFLVNTLALKADLTGDSTVATLLSRARETALNAYAHQDTPFERVVETVQIERDMSRSPLFQVMFSLQEESLLAHSIMGLELTPLFAGTERSKFDITLFAKEIGDDLSLSIEYNVDLFSENTISRMLAHLTKVIESIAMNPHQRLSEISLLLDSERDRVLTLWNNETVSYREDVLPHELFEHHANHRPTAIAVEDDNNSITFDELNRRSNQLAHFFIDKGASADMLVGICMNRSIDLIVAMLAVMKSGAAYVPIDPTYPGDRVALMLEDSNASIVLTQRDMRDALPKSNAAVYCIDADRSAVETFSDQSPTRRAQPTNLAYVIYTSGSTGKPKGVMIEHRNLLNLVHVHERVYGVTAHDTMAQVSGVSFDASVWEIWPQLCLGGRLVICSNEIRLSPEHLQTWLISKGITVAFLPTPLAERMLQMPWEKKTSLRLLLTGGDKLYTFAPKNLPFVLMNNYGPTEATVIATAGVVPHESECSAVPTLGKPLPNTKIYILDQGLRPTPVGIPGELCIGGRGVGRGYLNRPELTDEKFFSLAFNGHVDDRIYRTGDLARWLPNGEIEFLGRIDHQVKIRGQRIELGEIENAILRYPDVRETLVTDKVNGRGEKILVAFVAPKDDRNLTASILRTYLKTKLPMSMIPSSISVLDALPLLPTGKVDRRALLALEHDEDAAEIERVEPSTRTEIRVAQIWAELLGRQHIGVRDNFLDSGGHSLLAVQLVSKLSQAFEVEVPLRIAFEEPSIAEQAAWLDRQLGVATLGYACTESETALDRLPDSPAKRLIVPIRKRGGKRPVFVVAPAGGPVFAYYALAHHLGSNQPIYGLQDPALDGSGKPCSTIEEMAARYVEAMKAIQPEGPYIIGGWSLGGTIAYEIARQLDARHEDVLYLFLMETVTGIRKANKNFRERLISFKNNIASNISLALSGIETIRDGAFLIISTSWIGRKLFSAGNKSLGRITRLGGGALWKKFLKNAKMADVVSHEAQLLLIKQPGTALSLRIAYANIRALKRYKLPSYNGKVWLYMSKEKGQFARPLDPNRGWDTLAKGSVEARIVPGDHFSLLRNPDVKHLAQCVMNDIAILEVRRDASISTRPLTDAARKPTLVS